MTGTLIANQDADVAADAMGRISQTYVERGSFVPKGAPLARIDSRSLALTENEASAQVHALEVESSLATRDCARSNKLFEEGSISKAEHDRQSSRCESTGWSKTAAEARAQMAVKAVGEHIELLLVVGSQNSSNSRRLVEVCQNEGVPSYLLDDRDEVNPVWLEQCETVAVTAGASAPENLVQDLIHSLRTKFGFGSMEEMELKEEDVRFQLPANLERSALRLQTIARQ